MGVRRLSGPTPLDSLKTIHPGAHTFVFAYGSNLDPARMQERVVSARWVTRSVLPRHELRFHKRGWRDGTGKANAFATARTADTVYGVIWEIDAEHLADLDRHEGLGIGYERELRLFSAFVDDEPVKIEAWVYLATPDAIDDTLLPMKWYVKHVLRGALKNGFPGPVIQKLREHLTLDWGAAFEPRALGPGTPCPGG